MLLRPYQLEAVERVRAAMRGGQRRVLFVLPTGGGKTCVASHVVQLALVKGSRVLFVAHRMELIDQAVRTLEDCGVEDIGVMRANDPRTRPGARVQVASIQTLARRAKPPADLVIVDEAHRSAAASYVRHVFDSYKTVLGLTATPARQDGKPLGTLFGALILGARYSELLASGHIVAPKVYALPAPDLSRVKTRAGDYEQEALARACNTDELNGQVVETWLRLALGRRTVVFCVSIAHSIDLLSRFVMSAVKAEHLDGTTPEDERRGILARLASGATTVVCNVGVLCEGWDMPSCKCLVLARPTRSLVLYMQMAGRILRPYGTESPVILDHAGAVDAHGFPHMDRDWSLSDRVHRVAAPPSARMCPRCGASWPAGIPSCPACEYVTRERVLVPDETEAELVERHMPTPDEEWDKWVATARRKGYAPGWAYHRHEETFGRAPSREQWREIKRAFADDEAWQDKNRARGLTSAT
jgi:DNA repair protein RadD